MEHVAPLSRPLSPHLRGRPDLHAEIREASGGPSIVRQAGQAQAPLPARAHPLCCRKPLVGRQSSTQSALDAARRIGESVIVAAVTSAGLYLVGSVYADSYYSRLSIEPTSLDLPPPYVALQATHALKALLDYPTTLLVFYVLYRTFAPQLHRLQGWFDRVRQRFPRLLLILANIVVVSPLLIGALQASMQEQTLIPDSVRAEVASGLEDAAPAPPRLRHLARVEPARLHPL